ncbi:hypothetical protein [Streptomyces camelliae]|uniref:Uncharacterized protein n=1 Tax=Streptomyces camelliae TaxID=3004093 RepID=A0ABY7NV34_9ACTN|nr:hypothetical protein [Streptomyces sp. HUAS 2-6]WBO62108.1 hypothetical protein O1G22_04300 [Streptomyces sp. HUAS 2-6]
MSFELVTPGTPHRPGEPRHDLAMASHAVTKPLQDHPEDPASGRLREPKEACHALARRYEYAGAGRRGGA